jgi:hypothetical protein
MKYNDCTFLFFSFGRDVGGVNNMRRGDSPLVFTVRQTEARGHLTREREKKTMFDSLFLSGFHFLATIIIYCLN